MLNPAFITLAGEPNVWHAEMAALKDRGDSLTALQESQSQRGYLPVRLYESIHGWYVRYASGLQGFNILLNSRGLSREKAIAWGKAWVEEDPKNRHFYALKADLEKPDKWS